jgi:5-enolpyruvylshikimate-3-phosphate synthase
MASLLATRSIRIDGVANVATSFPGFPRVARAAGFNLVA